MKPQLTVGSVFSGIGGFDLGLERAGWRVVWQIENDPFRQKILRRHWPNVELRNDVRTDTDGLEPVQLICGGFPCQDLSIAGRGAGLGGERSALFFELSRLIGALRPRWLLIENVPALLNKKHERDFATVLDRLEAWGYGVAWRVLDSQYFGVAQRRNRVFIVGHLGAPCPPELLFEPESIGGPVEAGEEAREDIAGTLGGGAAERGWANDLDRSGAFIPTKARTLHTRGHRLDTDDIDTYVTARRSPSPDPDGVREATGVPGRLDASTPDGPRYAAIGDAVTVPVAEWLGRRIAAFAQGPGE